MSKKVWMPLAAVGIIAATGGLGAPAAAGLAKFGAGLKGFAATAGGGTALAAGATAAGSLYGAHRQAKGATESTRMQIEAAERAQAAELAANKEALDYQKSVDAQYRKDWEARESRLTPYRNLGQQGARTLGGLVRVPDHIIGNVPGGGSGRGGTSQDAAASAARGALGPDFERHYNEYRAAHGGDPTKFKEFLQGWTPYMKERGYGIEFMEHPTKHDKVRVSTPGGQRVVVDLVERAGAPDAKFGFMPEHLDGQTPTSGGGARGTLGAAAMARRTPMRVRENLVPDQAGMTSRIQPVMHRTNTLGRFA